MKPYELPMKPVYEPSNAILDYAQDFLQNHNLNLFCVIRCYPDGSITPFTMQPDALVDWFKWYPIVNLPIRPDNHQHMHAYDWDEILSTLNLSVLHKHSLYQGIILLFRYPNFVDIVCFSMPDKISQGKSFYFNHLSQLQEFYKNFLRHKADLISYYEKGKIILPVGRQATNLSDLVVSTPGKEYTFMGVNGFTHISEKEIFCINLLTLGFSYKDVGEIFGQKESIIRSCIGNTEKRIGYTHADELLKYKLSQCISEHRINNMH